LNLDENKTFEMTAENLAELETEEFAGSGLIVPVKRHCPDPVKVRDIKAKEEAEVRKAKATAAKAERDRLAGIAKAEAAAARAKKRLEA